MQMTFISVYKYQQAVDLLYALLKERTAEQSISHVSLPTWEQHVKFFHAHPYQYWYIIIAKDSPVGSIYLSKGHEIGIFIFRSYQRHKYGAAAVQYLMELHPGKFLANINPKNKASIKMFESLGFTHIQNTYKGPTGNPYERT